MSYMPLTVTVNTIAESLRTDCSILGGKNKKKNVTNIQEEKNLAVEDVTSRPSCEQKAWVYTRHKALRHTDTLMFNK